MGIKQFESWLTLETETAKLDVIMDILEKTFTLNALLLKENEGKSPESECIWFASAWYTFLIWKSIENTVVFFHLGKKKKPLIEIKEAINSSTELSSRTLILFHFIERNKLLK